MERHDPKPIFHAISATTQLVVIISMLLIAITSIVMIIGSIVAGISSAVIE